MMALTDVNTPGGSLTLTVTNDEFVDINTLGKLDLPTLPVLKQEKDWKQWWNSVTAYFEVLELDNFFDMGHT